MKLCDFKAGDTVLCIEGEDSPNFGVKEGHTYVISDVDDFVRIPINGKTNGGGFSPERFVKLPVTVEVMEGIPADKKDIVVKALLLNKINGWQ